MYIYILSDLSQNICDTILYPTVEMQNAWKDPGRFMEYREGNEDDKMGNPFELSASLI